MLNWLLSNIGTIVVALVIAGIIAGVIIWMTRDRKKGKSLCGNNCSSCAMHGQCHKR